MEPQEKWWQRYDPLEIAVGIVLGILVASSGIVAIIAAIKGS